MDCQKNSFCAIDPSSQEAHCECNKGFTAFGASGCADINECADQNDCSVNADCLNTEGSYQCQCHPGYVGNGRECHKKITCDDLNCHAHAVCNIGTTSTSVYQYSISNIVRYFGLLSYIGIK